MTDQRPSCQFLLNSNPLSSFPAPQRMLSVIFYWRKKITWKYIILFKSIPQILHHFPLCLLKTCTSTFTTATPTSIRLLMSVRASHDQRLDYGWGGKGLSFTKQLLCAGGLPYTVGNGRCNIFSVLITGQALH